VETIANLGLIIGILLIALSVPKRDKRCKTGHKNNAVVNMGMVKIGVSIFVVSLLARILISS